MTLPVLFSILSTEKITWSITVEKPEKPGLNECCGGGSCCPCVWDDYFDKLEKWQALQEKAQEQASENEPD